MQGKWALCEDPVNFERVKMLEASICENPLARVDLARGGFEVDLETAAMIVACDAYPKNRFEIEKEQRQKPEQKPSLSYNQAQCFWTIIANYPTDSDTVPTVDFVKFVDGLREEGVTRGFHRDLSGELKDAIRSMKNRELLKPLDEREAAGQWMTVKEATNYLLIYGLRTLTPKSVGEKISRACSSGKLESEGARQKRRVNRTSLYKYSDSLKLTIDRISPTQAKESAQRDKKFKAERRSNKPIM